MKERICRICAISGTVLGLVVLLFGCATVPVPEQADTQESLRDTASLYWKLRMDDNYKDTFKMEDKDALQKVSGKGKPPYESYVDQARAIKNNAINSYSIKDVTLQDDKGRVSVEFTFTMPEIPRPVSQIVTDEWIFKNGKWLHLPPR